MPRRLITSRWICKELVRLAFFRKNEDVQQKSHYSLLVSSVGSEHLKNGELAFRKSASFSQLYLGTSIQLSMFFFFLAGVAGLVKAVFQHIIVRVREALEQHVVDTKRGVLVANFQSECDYLAGILGAGIAWLLLPVTPSCFSRIRAVCV